MNDYTMAPGVSTSEQDARAKAYEAWYKTDVRHGTISDQESNPRLFPFLKLPAEIRNQIYRLALLTSNTTTDRPKQAKITCEPPSTNEITQTNEVSVGSVQCQSSRTYILEYQVSILRLNKMTHREAWGIFNLENFWAIVRVNKVGFGKQLKKKGFPVALGDNLWDRIRHPVMKVTVIFSTLSDQEQSEDFVLATVHLSGLIRALWTAKGASEMEVNVHFQRRLTSIQPSKCELLEPFLKLRNIKRVSLSTWDRHWDLYPRGHTPTHDINFSFDEMKKSLWCLQRYVQEEQWEQALLKASEHSTLFDDCRIVYGPRLLGMEPRLDLNTVFARSNTAKELIITTSLAFAEIALNLQRYPRTIYYANHALHTCRVTIFPAVVPAHITIPPSSHQCLSLLFRASAYIGQNKSEAALDDIKKVREIIPDFPKLASVSNAWQETFGPFPDSTNPPVAS